MYLIDHINFKPTLGRCILAFIPQIAHLLHGIVGCPVYLDYIKTSSFHDGLTNFGVFGHLKLEVPEDSEIGQSIMEGRCLDVIEIDGASNNSVEQVRDLRDECQYAPSQCRFKIYVIDEVHMLSSAYVPHRSHKF